MKSRYSKEEFKKLLTAYASLRWETEAVWVQNGFGDSEAKADGEGTAKALLADPWMILAIQERIWTPPEPPTQG